MGFIKRIDTVFVPVLDIENSERWYSKVFGFRVVYRSPEGDYVGFRFDEPGPLETGLTIYRVDAMPREKHIPFNFFSGDLSQTRDHLDSLEVPMSDVRQVGGMSIFNIEDPDGNLYDIVHFEESKSIKKEVKIPLEEM